MDRVAVFRVLLSKQTVLLEQSKYVDAPKLWEHWALNRVMDKHFKIFRNDYSNG